MKRDIRLLYRTVQLVDAEKLTISELAERLGINDTSFWRFRQRMEDTLGVCIERPEGVPHVYVTEFGLLDRNAVRHAAARFARESRPGGFRKAMIERKVTI